MKIKNLRVLLLSIFVLSGFPLFAYVVEYYNFYDQNNYVPVLEPGRYEQVSAGYIPFYSNSIVKSTGVGSAGTVAIVPKVTEKPLLYPNPLRCKDHPKLGFGLSKEMAMELRIYDARANEVYKKLYSNGMQGSRQGYNLVDLTEFVTSFDLSSGVYVFVLINDNKVLGKGKFVVMP